ncbi:MAG: hypothetical protein ACR2IP_10875 [Solirubrobacteraceae bacterium]
MLTLATSNTGFYIGIILGFVAVVAVVVLVAVILTFASRIGDQAEVAAEALDAVRKSTNVLPAVYQTNDHAVAILQGAKTARGALTG